MANVNEPSSATPTNASTRLSEFDEAYQRRLPEIVAVAESDLVPVTVDVHAAVTTVLGCISGIMRYRDQIATLAQVDQKAIDGLRDYALATGQANSIYTTALTPHDDISAMNDEALTLLALLRSDANALAKRALIDPARLAPLKGAPGYRNVAFDLIDYANLLNSVWDSIQNKTALQRSEINHALKLGEKLVFAIGRREQAPAKVAEAARIRAQAFTLFCNAYSETRRALQFLRFHEGDAETIAPSLYAGRGGRGKTATDGASSDATLVSGTPVAVTTPVSANAANGSNTAGHAPIPPGMPGASPFIR